MNSRGFEKNPRESDRITETPKECGRTRQSTRTVEKSSKDWIEFDRIGENLKESRRVSKNPHAS